MPRAVENVVVKAPIDTVWELLIDKAENPQRYLEGILDFRILGRTKEIAEELVKAAEQP